MNDTTFTTVDIIKQDTAISSAVSPSLIEPFIKSAEIFWLKPVLGETFYNELLNEIDDDTLSGHNKTLVYDYIIPASNWFTYYEAVPFIAYRAEAKGLTKKFSDNSTPLDKKEYESYKQSIIDKAHTWKNRMIDYLYLNQSYYPLWRDTCDNIFLNKHYSGGIFL
jgi:hypothetical protein